MELTYHTDYGLRVLMYAGAHRDRRVTMREIAQSYDISLEHLRKVVHRLAQHGYLITTKGRAGGLTLGAPPETMRIGDIVLAMEESMAIIDCNRQPCPLCGGCSLKAVLESARTAFIEQLNTFTLEDVLGDTTTFGQLQRLTQPA
ncbi:RrF2 family transcriptional regulator [Aquisalimonas asiatica]|uniref:Transcriptional regulator, BadM/Rrf2 family n=1 Tax=Aquisalimonas asiatica TaxID=406100 RepID=A0A1H8Q4B3_9GAMM|nr:Rrf2 family transcriptional regulator [Aquisalimonas asiatica]SEO48734.1 transcriptional regulator, BadM/Rrf2 family [Aquisalimonas asiatica]